MALYLTGLLLLVAVLIALDDWRRGLFLCVVVAIVQDPLRKLVPDQPAYFILLVGVVFIAVCIATPIRVAFDPSRITGWNRHIRNPFILLIILILLQSAHSFALFANPVLTGLGLVSYIAPLPAMLLGHYYAKRNGYHGVERWLWFYLVVAIVALITVCLEYFGIKWPILGEVGTGIIIYDARVSSVLKANSGSFRASEVAAWHAATAACLVVFFTTSKRLSVSRVAVALGIAFLLIGVGVLTGRRKMLMEFALFLSGYLFLILWFSRRWRNLAIIAALCGALSYVGMGGMLGPDPVEVTRLEQTDNYSVYVARTQSVFGDAWGRFMELGLAPIQWALDQYGVFGIGVGPGSQGGQHLGGGAEEFGGSAEGGLGKITMELGLPGLALVIWLGVALWRHIWDLLIGVSARSQKLARMGYGLLAFLIANVATFTIATQVYGDIFVLLILGLCLGFLLAMPLLAEREVLRALRSRG